MKKSTAAKLSSVEILRGIVLSLTGDRCHDRFYGMQDRMERNC